MKLVEIIRGLATADEVYKAVEDMTVKLSKTPVEVNDFPGFVANRILMPMINEAIYTLYEGVATKEAIDEVMKLGMNHPMGPCNSQILSDSILVYTLWKRCTKDLAILNIVHVHCLENM